MKILKKIFKYIKFIDDKCLDFMYKSGWGKL